MGDAYALPAHCDWPGCENLIRFQVIDWHGSGGLYCPRHATETVQQLNQQQQKGEGCTKPPPQHQSAGGPGETRVNLTRYEEEEEE